MSFCHSQICLKRTLCFLLSIQYVRTPSPSKKWLKIWFITRNSFVKHSKHWTWEKICKRDHGPKTIFSGVNSFLYWLQHGDYFKIKQDNLILIVKFRNLWFLIFNFTFEYNINNCSGFLMMTRNLLLLTKITFLIVV